MTSVVPKYLRFAFYDAFIFQNYSISQKYWIESTEITTIVLMVTTLTLGFKSININSRLTLCMVKATMLTFTPWDHDTSPEIEVTFRGMLQSGPHQYQKHD